VLFLGWRIFPLLALFWMETIVVGAFYILRILCAMPGSRRWWFSNPATAIYFCLPYGAFVVFLGLLLFSLFGDTGMEGPQLAWESPRLVAELLRDDSVRYSLYALTGSHLFSFLWDYLAGGEFRRLTPEQVANQPYGRHAVLLVALCAGIVPAWLTNYSFWALVLLVVLKTTGDLYGLFRAGRVPV